MRYYALAEWRQVDDPEAGQYMAAPEGSLGLVDLSPATGREWLFVTSDAPYKAAANCIPLGDGKALDGYALTSPERSAWEAALGVTAPNGTLLDALWAVLTVDADPTRMVRCKPILPTHLGVLELHLGGHSLIRSRKWEGETDPAAGPVLAVVRADYARCVSGAEALAAAYREAREGDALMAQIEVAADKGVSIEGARELLATAAEEHPLKVLGGLERKYRVPTASLVDQALDPRWAESRKPTTTVTDDFNRSDGSGLGANWTFVGSYAAWSIYSNTARCVKTAYQAGAYAFELERYDSLLSSDDHVVAASMAELGGGNTWGAGLSARLTGTTDRSGYLAGFYGASTLRLYRSNSSGSVTILGGATIAAFDSAVNYSLTADGSTITVERAGTIAISITDTAVTGNVYTGLWDLCQNNHSWVTDARFDDFSAEDLVAGSSAPVFMNYYRRMRVA